MKRQYISNHLLENLEISAISDQIKHYFLVYKTYNTEGHGTRNINLYIIFVHRVECSGDLHQLF